MPKNPEETNPATSVETASSPGAGMDRRIEAARLDWWKRRSFWAVIAVLFVAILAWRFVPASGSTNVDANDIQTGEIVLASFEDYLPVRASVVPATTTLVGVMVDGQVEELLVQDGAVVAKGQALARMDNPELRIQVLSQEAQIASQLGGVAGENLSIQRLRLDRAGQISQAEFDLIQARRELDIREELRNQGFVSEAGVRSYEDEVAYQTERLSQLRAGRAAESRITATQGAMLGATQRRLQQNLTAVRESLEALTLRAPMAGRLTNFDLQPGQRLTQGDPAGQIDSEGSWKLLADVDEYFLGRVQVGQSATTPAGDSLVVSRVLPTVADGRFQVELTFEGNIEGDLNRGQTLDVRITLGAAASATIAPVGGWLDDNETSVFVVDASGSSARRTTIQVGRRNPSQVEILSGLEPGQWIVTSDLSEIQSDTINIR